MSTYGAMGTTDVSSNARPVGIESGEIMYAGNATSDNAVVMLGTVGESINTVVNSLAKNMARQLRE